MPLSDISVRNAKPAAKARKVADELGLYLVVTPAGGKLWRMDYRFAGKRYTLSFGKWPKVGLAAARMLRDQAREDLAKGVDPRSNDQSEAGAGDTVTDTVNAGDDFKSVAERWLARSDHDWSPGHIRRTNYALTNDIYPEIGALLIGDIEPTQVLAMVRKIEGRGVREGAHRARALVSQVFRFAIAEGLTKHNPAGDIAGALIRKPKTQHRAAFSRAELPQLVERLRAEPLEPLTRDALWLTLFTAVRTKETRFAAAGEFEGLGGPDPLWRIPSERMKMDRPHIVPLPRQAVEIVRRRIARAPESGLLFQKTDNRSGVLSENAMLYALYRMGYHSRLTVHGFRGAFSTIANEANWNRDWIELQLAHYEGSVRSTYNAAQYLEGRRELLQWWADLVEGG